MNFRQLLEADGAVNNGVHENVTIYSKLPEETKRQLAVVAALELINSDISASYSSASAARKNADLLKAHIENLSSYADFIVNAMKINDQ